MPLKIEQSIRPRKTCPTCQRSLDYMAFRLTFDREQERVCRVDTCRDCEKATQQEPPKRERKRRSDCAQFIQPESETIHVPNIARRGWDLKPGSDEKPFVYQITEARLLAAERRYDKALAAYCATVPGSPEARQALDRLRRTPFC